MSETAVEPRQAAILAADLAGHGRIIRKDGVTMVERVKASRERVGFPQDGT